MKKFKELREWSKKDSRRYIRTPSLGLTTPKANTTLKESSVPHQGHPYHKESDEGLHYIMKDAKEAADDAKRHHDHEVAAEYEEQHKKAGHILAYRQGGGKQVKEDYKYEQAMTSRLPAHLEDPRVEPAKKALKKVRKDPKNPTWKLYREQALSEASVPLSGHPFHTKTDAELHDIARDASHTFPAHLKHTNELNKQRLAAVKTILAHRHGIKETELNEETEREAKSHKERMSPASALKDDADKQIKKDDKPNVLHTNPQAVRLVNTFGKRAFPGGKMPVKEEHQTDFPHAGKVVKDPFGKNTYHFYSGTNGKSERNEYAKHLRSIGNTIKLGSRKPGEYHIIKAHLAEEASTPHPGFVMNFSSHTEHQYHGFGKAKQERDEYARHLKSLGHKVKKGSTANQLLHGTYGNVYHVSYKPDHLKESEIAFNESGPETYKVGDKVIPKIGPHKGSVHSVIYVHPTGHLNIKPDFTFGRNQYHLGAAKADPKDVTRHLGESLASSWKHNHHDSQRQDPGKWLKNRGERPEDDSQSSDHRKKKAALKDRISVLNRKTVQEVFQAAKDKKKGENPFAKKDTDAKAVEDPKDLKPKDDQDPQQADVNAKPAQFGGKAEGADKSTEKKNNTPEPEKKGAKLKVQGAGPDDKFQPDPCVTPLTTMPDTVSPKSGSQGVR